MADDRFVKILGDRLRARRAALSLSQLAVATAADITERGYRKMEADSVAQVRRATIHKLAAALHVPLNVFMAEYVVADSPAPESIQSLEESTADLIARLQKKREEMRLPPVPETIIKWAHKLAAKPAPGRHVKD